jgi:hypothetical protein
LNSFAFYEFIKGLEKQLDPSQDQINEKKEFEESNYGGSLSKFLGLNKLVKSQ